MFNAMFLLVNYLISSTPFKGVKMKKYLKLSLAIIGIASISVANEPNIDRPGNDYKQLGNLRDASVCEQKCHCQADCNA